MYGIMKISNNIIPFYNVDVLINEYDDDDDDGSMCVCSDDDM